MMALWLQECRKIGRSLPFWLFVLATAAMLQTQFIAELKPIMPPQPGEQNYGTVRTESPEIIMPAALQSLFAAYSGNGYSTYPWGFIKHVKLNARKQEQMAGILSELTGIPTSELSRYAPAPANELQFGPDGKLIVPGEQEAAAGDAPPVLTPLPGLGYEQFAALMKQADRLIGGGSSYAPSALLQFGRAPATYEDALASYQAVVEQDRITGAHARLFTTIWVSRCRLCLSLWPCG